MNIVSEVIDYLFSTLGVPAYAEEQHSPPVQYLIIEKTGGGQTNLINQSTIAIQSYSNSLYNASALNEDVKAAMADMIALDGISAVKLNSDYNWTDEETRRYRYQAVFDITHR